jgi:hypothetical protein
MLENTNALIGALTALLSESSRLEKLIASGSLSDDDEERLMDRVEQMHLAFGDLSEEYERRLPAHPGLVSLDALKSRIEADAGR